MGKWDVYLISPDGAKLQSNPDLVRYEAKNPEVAIDIRYVNFERNSQLQEEDFVSHKQLHIAEESTKGKPEEYTREMRCFDILLSDKEVEPLSFSEVEDFEIATENIELVA